MFSHTNTHSSNPWIHQGGNKIFRHFPASNKWVNLQKMSQSLLNYVSETSADLLERFLFWVLRDEEVRGVHFLRKYNEKYFPLKENVFQIKTYIKRFQLRKVKKYQLTEVAFFIATLAGKTRLKTSWGQNIFRYQYSPISDNVVLHLKISHFQIFPKKWNVRHKYHFP